MSKTRKKKKFQLRKKNKNNGSSIPKVSEAVNKRAEKKIFKIAIITTVVLLVVIYLIFTSMV